MTQWKVRYIGASTEMAADALYQSKLNLPQNANLDSDEATAKLKLGLFSYPVLQAADILLYQSVYPVVSQVDGF